MRICVIGGGASGMTAALSAAACPGAEVLLLERQARLGRKLLATGNGRCNLTNLAPLFARYHGYTPDFSRFALEAFPAEQTRAWFRSMGLFTVAEAGGRVYPYSDQANSVVDVLRFALDKPNITVVTGAEVSAIRRSGSGFSVVCTGGAYACARVIVACGGMAGAKLGGSSAGYRLLSALGHTVTPLRPSLVQLKSDWFALPSLKGVRANCRAQIFRNGQLFSESSGEIQFTDYGLSGPVIFEISRDVCRGGGDWECRLDLLPDVGADALFAALSARRDTALPVQELLTGVLHNRLGRVLCKSAGLRADTPIRTLSDAELQAVCALVKCLRVSLTAPLGMDAAQVTAGGVRTAEFDPHTMESRIVPGLFACGEVLDIDGDCGGFNLQWAWSSGRLAGMHAGGAV